MPLTKDEYFALLEESLAMLEMHSSNFLCKRSFSASAMKTLDWETTIKLLLVKERAQIFEGFRE